MRNFFCQLCGVFHLEWGLAEGRTERTDEVPDLFLCPVLALLYHSIAHFSKEISLLFQTQFFQKSLRQQQHLHLPSRRQCPIKRSYPCRKNNIFLFPSLSPSPTQSIINIISSHSHLPSLSQLPCLVRNIHMPELNIKH